MKIAIFSDTFLPLTDGVVTATLNLAKGLAKKGHKVIIVAPKFHHTKSIEIHKNIKIIQMKSVSSIIHKEYRATAPFDPLVFASIKKEKIDLIHINAPWTVGFQGIIIAKTLGIPLVGTFHTFHADPDYLKNVKLSHPFFESAVWEYQLMYYNKCDIITCPSEYAKDELKKHGCKRPIRYISNGIDPKIFSSKNSKKIKEKYGQPILLTVGRVAVEKNLIHMLKAINIVLRKHNNVKLIMVGSGPQVKEIKEKIRDMDLDEHVVMLGKIPHEKLVKSGIYGSANLFLITSKTETGPITVLEAYANKVPCIGVNAKNLPFIITDKKSGLVVDSEDPKEFANAIDRCLSDKELYNKLKRGTQSELKKHDINNIIEQWEELYANMIEKNKGRSIVKKIKKVFKKKSKAD